MTGTSSQFPFPVATASPRAAVQATTRTSSPDDCGAPSEPAFAFSGTMVELVAEIAASRLVGPQRAASPERLLETAYGSVMSGWFPGRARWLTAVSVERGCVESVWSDVRRPTRPSPGLRVPGPSAPARSRHPFLAGMAGSCRGPGALLPEPSGPWSRCIGDGRAKYRCRQRGPPRILPTLRQCNVVLDRCGHLMEGGRSVSTTQVVNAAGSEFPCGPRRLPLLDKCTATFLAPGEEFRKQVAVIHPGTLPW